MDIPHPPTPIAAAASETVAIVVIIAIRLTTRRVSRIRTVAAVLALLDIASDDVLRQRARRSGDAFRLLIIQLRILILSVSIKS